MKKIKLTQGQFAIVDDVDYEWLKQYTWCAAKKGRHYYAVTPDHIYMRRLILGLKKGDGKIVDHINQNSLNNRRCNLRLCTKSLNARNNILHKGYYWHKGTQKWYAAIGVEGRRIYLGIFKKEIDAALAYKQAANYFNK